VLVVVYSNYLQKSVGSSCQQNITQSPSCFIAINVQPWLDIGQFNGYSMPL